MGSQVDAVLSKEQNAKGVVLGTLGRGRTIPAGKNIIRNWGIGIDSIYSFYISPKDIVKFKYHKDKLVSHQKK